MKHLETDGNVTEKQRIRWQMSRIVNSKITNVVQICESHL